MKMEGEGATIESPPATIHISPDLRYLVKSAQRGTQRERRTVGAQ